MFYLTIINDENDKLFNYFYFIIFIKNNFLIKMLNYKF
jgi:hypothetical protein